jgi:hypothetical protein
LDVNPKFGPKAIKFLKIWDTFNPNSIDCTEDDNTDPHGLQDFLCNHALSDQEQNISVTYLASYENKILGYCTVAISSLPFEKYLGGKPPVREEMTKYPVLYIANLATDKNSRKVKGVGSEILRHCVGMGAVLSDMVGCRYVMLHATTAEKFYSEKNKTEYKFFVAKEEKDGRKLMLYRLHKKIHRHLSENISITHSVSAKVTKAADLQKMKNNPQLCSICKKEKEIVLRDGNFKLCKVCQDNLKEKYGY